VWGGVATAVARGKAGVRLGKATASTRVAPVPLVPSGRAARGACRQLQVGAASLSVAAFPS